MRIFMSKMYTKVQSILEVEYVSASLALLALVAIYSVVA